MNEEIEHADQKPAEEHYSLNDDRRVKDHRTGCQTSDVDAVMDGEIDAFIKAYLMQFGAEA